MKERERRGQGEREWEWKRERKKVWKGQKWKKRSVFLLSKQLLFQLPLPYFISLFCICSFCLSVNNHFGWRLSFLKKSSSLLQYSFSYSIFRHSHLQTCLIYLLFFPRLSAPHILQSLSPSHPLSIALSGQGFLGRPLRGRFSTVLLRRYLTMMLCTVDLGMWSSCPIDPSDLPSFHRSTTLWRCSTSCSLVFRQDGASVEAERGQTVDTGGVGSGQSVA